MLAMAVFNRRPQLPVFLHDYDRQLPDTSTLLFTTSSRPFSRSFAPFAS